MVAPCGVIVPHKSLNVKELERWPGLGDHWTARWLLSDDSHSGNRIVRLPYTFKYVIQAAGGLAEIDHDNLVVALMDSLIQASPQAG
mgnify:CR=1 FL=1